MYTVPVIVCDSLRQPSLPAADKTHFQYRQIRSHLLNDQYEPGYGNGAPAHKDLEFPQGSLGRPEGDEPGPVLEPTGTRVNDWRFGL